MGAAPTVSSAYLHYLMRTRTIILMAATQPRGMSMLFDVWLIMHSMTTLLDEALAPTPLSGDDFGLYSLLRG